MNRVALTDRGRVGVCRPRRECDYLIVGSDEAGSDGQLMANTWQGRFLYQNDGMLGWMGTSPWGFPGQPFRVGGHDRQRVGVDHHRMLRAPSA